MKSKKLINFILGTGFVFGGINSAKAQELDLVKEHLPKVGNMVGIIFITTEPRSNVDLWIDDVEIYGCDSYPPPLADAGLNKVALNPNSQKEQNN